MLQSVGKRREKELLLSLTVLSTPNLTLSMLTTTSLENLEKVLPVKHPGKGTYSESIRSAIAL
jgi:hypothetical protein